MNKGIQARAVRRAGQLLKEFQTSPQGGRPGGNGAGGDTVSQRQAAAAAGMSKDQEVTAAGARFEQELARLFYRSGWTQEELAKKEGLKQPTVCQRLQFGRFLDFIGTTNNPAISKLTQSKFNGKNGYWSRTDKIESNERIRFKAVLLAAPSTNAL